MFVDYLFRIDAFDLVVVLNLPGYYTDRYVSSPPWESALVLRTS